MMVSFLLAGDAGKGRSDERVLHPLFCVLELSVLGSYCVESADKLLGPSFSRISSPQSPSDPAGGGISRLAGSESFSLFVDLVPG
jgi:hypothetical protein